MIKELCTLANFSAKDGEYLEECLLKIFADAESVANFFKASDDYFDKGEFYL